MMDAIRIEGASEHNLQHVSLAVPRNKLVLFTGVSGSGKSSLAFDTLFAEGQRRYVESLGSYARQFLGQMDRPKVESIRGLTPTIAIEQRRTAANPRSTLATVTEIHDHLRLLWARFGVQHCTACGRVVEAQSAAAIVAEISALPEGTRFLLLAPIVRGERGAHTEQLEAAQRDGYVRVRVDGQIHELDQALALDGSKCHDIELVVDRLVSKHGAESRVAGSVETALAAGAGELQVLLPDSGKLSEYSEVRSCSYCRISFDPLIPASFSFNSLHGMCSDCGGLGRVDQLDENLLVPDRAQSIHQGAIEPWAEQCQQREGRIYSWVRAAAERLELDLDARWDELPESGRRDFLEGADQFAKLLGEQTKALDAYTGGAPCTACNGARLGPASRAVALDGMTIQEVSALTVGAARARIASLALPEAAAEIARELDNRLALLIELGLDYLTLDRAAGSLSGGEAQRIRLAGQLGGQLSGVTYVLDEPSVGLHPRDTRQLIGMLLRLRDLGNTVVVVEHDEAAILAADYLFDFGPGAGVRGGQIVFSGTPDALLQDENSLTGKYLSGRMQVPIPQRRRGPSRTQLVVRGARCNNLRGFDVAFPLERFIVVSGISGAGKSSLIGDLLVPALSQALHGARVRPGAHDAIEGIEQLDRVIQVDQRPIGRSPRSNPATYTKVYAEIRQLFAELKESKMHGFDAGRFSFNRKGGRCEACQGQGLVRIEMHFMPDVFTVCELCDGRRFNDATLRVRYRGYSIAEVLALSVADALELFARHPRIADRLRTLVEVGLDYLALGQSATTLSGGEAQRIKLARELSRKHRGRTLYVLDEPTTGLHAADVARLVPVLQQLVEVGNTVLVIEHDREMILQADHVIDLGPEAGVDGGRIVAQGTPEEIAQVAESHTGRYLGLDR